VKTSRKNKKPKTPKDSNKKNKNIKRRIMELGQNCRDVSDLSQKLQEVKINTEDLGFGPRTFEFTPGMDFLDFCI
jgi:hypothetical protein